MKRFVSTVVVITALFVVGCGSPVGELSAPSVSTPAFAKLTDLRQQLDSGALTSEQLVRLSLDRMAAYDARGPELNAMITVNQYALETARALDAELRDHGPRGPLHGIPIILKDNYDTADMPTSGGSAILASSQPTDHAFVVQRLRHAGAVILGKANMSEFALSYGWLGYGSAVGQTRNPHNPLRDPSGSSSGSAAAVAAGYAPLATGTDTAGSVRGPAAVCGVVGIKPTLGLVSRDGIIPASLTFDVAGPIARSVTGAATLLHVMAGADPSDPATTTTNRREIDLAAALKPEGLRGARLGVVRAFTGANTSVDAVIARALEHLAAKGAELIEVDLPGSLSNLWPVMGPVVDADFSFQIEAYLSELPGEAPRTVDDLIEQAESPDIAESATPLNPARVQGFRDAAASGGEVSPERMRSLNELLPAARETLLSVLDANDVDALVFATLPCPASPRHDAEDPAYVCEIDDPYRPCYLASATGFPEITVPAGFASDGLPVGLSLLGRPFSENRLIALALDFEQATNALRAPKSTPQLTEATQ